jgi:hypothetical protein
MLPPAALFLGRGPLLLVSRVGASRYGGGSTWRGVAAAVWGSGQDSARCQLREGRRSPRRGRKTGRQTLRRTRGCPDHTSAVLASAARRRGVARPQPPRQRGGVQQAQRLHLLRLLGRAQPVLRAGARVVTECGVCPRVQQHPRRLHQPRQRRGAQVVQRGAAHLRTTRRAEEVSSVDPERKQRRPGLQPAHRRSPCLAHPRGIGSSPAARAAPRRCPRRRRCAA